MDIEGLRSICLALPGVEEDVKWGNDLCFLVGKKMFAVSGLEGPLKVSFKVQVEDFSGLCDRHGIIPAPYLARNNWVAVTEPDALSPEEWQTHLQESYRLVFSKLPRKLQGEISGQKKTG